jgi:hypothetical protein
VGVSEEVVGRRRRKYLGRTGLEGLHGPSEHLVLALGELRGAVGGGGSGVFVGHGDVG